MKATVMVDVNGRLREEHAGSSWAGFGSSGYKHAGGRISNNWTGSVEDYEKRTAMFDIAGYEQLRLAETARA